MTDNEITKIWEQFDHTSFNRQSVAIEFARAILNGVPAPSASPAPKLAVWYGPMPESNGKSNWTAILHTGDIAHGITLDRSEYPDRVRYEADRARWLIGELAAEPFILDYDADKHSGYVAPAREGASPADQREDAFHAKLYRWLREQHWNESTLFVVNGHHSRVRLGTDCPSGDRLDAIILAAMGESS